MTKNGRTNNNEQIKLKKLSSVILKKHRWYCIEQSIAKGEYYGSSK